MVDHVWFIYKPKSVCFNSVRLISGELGGKLMGGWWQVHHCGVSWCTRGRRGWTACASVSIYMHTHVYLDMHVVRQPWLIMSFLSISLISVLVLAYIQTEMVMCYLNFGFLYPSPFLKEENGSSWQRSFCGLGKTVVSNPTRTGCTSDSSVVANTLN